MDPIAITEATVIRGLGWVDSTELSPSVTPEILDALDIRDVSFFHLKTDRSVWQFTMGISASGIIITGTAVLSESESDRHGEDSQCSTTNHLPRDQLPDWGKAQCESLERWLSARKWLYAAQSGDLAEVKRWVAFDLKRKSDPNWGRYAGKRRESAPWVELLGVRRWLELTKIFLAEAKAEPLLYFGSRSIKAGPEGDYLKSIEASWKSLDTLKEKAEWIASNEEFICYVESLSEAEVIAGDISIDYEWCISRSGESDYQWWLTYSRVV